MVEENKIIEEVAPIETKDTIIKRGDLSLRNFMDDMSALGTQVIQTPDKPAFNYGSLEITNYLLWLILGELMMINDSEVVEETTEETMMEEMK